MRGYSAWCGNLANLRVTMSSAALIKWVGFPRKIGLAYWSKEDVAARCLRRTVQLTLRFGTN